MQNIKNIYNFYQSSGVYDRVIFQNKNIKKQTTIIDLKQKILALKEVYGKTKEQLVLSDGNIQSKIMIIGDMPGVSDEISNQPFSGDVGVLLNKMLNAIELDRSKVYLTNIINYRLADNKKPNLSDISRFKPLVLEHIEICKPVVILLLGSVAFETFFGNKNSIAKARGNWLDLTIKGKKIKCLPSYHPFFLIRQPEQKKYSWEDLKLLKKKINEEKLC